MILHDRFSNLFKMIFANCIMPINLWQVGPSVDEIWHTIFAATYGGVHLSVTVLSARRSDKYFKGFSGGSSSPAEPPSALDEPQGFATVWRDLQAGTRTRLWCEPFVKKFILDPSCVHYDLTLGTVTVVNILSFWQNTIDGKYFRQEISG